MYFHMSKKILCQNIYIHVYNLYRVNGSKVNPSMSYHFVMLYISRLELMHTCCSLDFKCLHFILHTFCMNLDWLTHFILDTPFCIISDNCISRSKIRLHKFNVVYKISRSLFKIRRQITSSIANRFTMYHVTISLCVYNYLIMIERIR